MNFDMPKPCANCPFKKEGAIDLRPGRLDGIAQGLLADDGTTFQCHKTVHGPRGGKWSEDNEGESCYEPSGKESACTGAMIFLLKAKSPNVSMRMGAALGLLDYDKLRQQADTVIEPEPKHFRKPGRSPARTRSSS